MLRKNFPHRKEQRRKDAAARQGDQLLTLHGSDTVAEPSEPGPRKQKKGAQANA